MTGKAQAASRGPGRGILVLQVVLLVLGSGAAAVVGTGSEDGAGAWGAMAGWSWAGLLGLTGWWTSRKALCGSQRDLLRYMVGGMLVRMVLCGAGAGVVVATGCLHQNGFILGLLVGIPVFLGVEIAGLQVAARRLSAGCA